MAIGHPSLFRLAFLRVVPDLNVGPATRAAATEAFELLSDRFRSLEAAGLLGGRHPRVCAAIFNALCEGMATTELRIKGLLGPNPEHAWRQAFTALVAGLNGPSTPRDTTWVCSAVSSGDSSVAIHLRGHQVDEGKAVQHCPASPEG